MRGSTLIEKHLSKSMLRALSAATLSLLYLACPGTAQDESASEARLKAEAAIQAATELSQQAKWRRAKQAWLNLLRQHAGAEYLRPYLPDIREAIFTADFWAAHRRPLERGLVAGNLETYVRSSGRVEIDYDMQQLEDFEPVGAMLLHPLYFRGKHSIEVEAAPSAVPELFFCLEEDRGYRLRIGGFNSTHQIFRLEAGKQSEMEGGLRQLRSRGREPTSVKVKVTVTRTQISVSYNGKQLFKVRKSDEAYGRFGFMASKRFTRIKMSGIASNSWMEGRVDQAMQAEWTAFESEYALPKEFLAWELGEAQAVPIPAEDAEARIPFPDEFNDEQWKQVRWIVAMLEAGQYHKAKLTIGLMDDQQVPPRTRQFLLAQVEMRAGRYQRAVESMRTLAAEKSAAFEHKLLLARLLVSAEQEAAALGEYQKLLKKHPEEASVQYEIAELLMLTAKTAEARAQVETGLVRFPDHADSRTLLRQIVKIEQGPPWRRSFRKESEHFLVVSELSQSLSQSVSLELEAAWQYFEERFGELPPKHGKTPVYIFSGEAGYKHYIDDIAYEAPENTAGIYSSRLGQILVWNLESAEKIEHTLRHEALHRYLHLRLGKTPHWFNEGLAEFLAHAKLGRREWVEGTPSTYWAMVLRRYELSELPLGQFMRQQHEAFMATAQINYALSWALVDFLLTKGEAEREYFDALWNLLEGEIDAGSAVERLLEERDLQALEQGFREHLREIGER